jgi:hypothetical protein
MGTLCACNDVLINQSRLHSVNDCLARYTVVQEVSR